MTLDMILAEKVWRGMCPDWEWVLHIHPQQHSSGWHHNQGSPSPDSPVRQLAKNSGINDPFTNWLEQWLRKWKGVMTSILTSLIVVFGAMVLIGCCVKPCIQGLILRLIETTLTTKTLYHTNCCWVQLKSQIMLNEFEEKNEKKKSALLS
jgi:hypothetical protein